MKALKGCCFALTAMLVVSLYVVAPIAVTFRPVLGGLLRPLAAAIAITLLCAMGIITVLRRAAPFVAEPRGLLTMPVVPNCEIPAWQERYLGHVVKVSSPYGPGTSLANGGPGPLPPGSIPERPARPGPRPQTRRTRGRHRSQKSRYRNRAS
jgi:hypothetical protein